MTTYVIAALAVIVLGGWLLWCSVPVRIGYLLGRRVEQIRRARP